MQGVCIEVDNKLLNKIKEMKSVEANYRKGEKENPGWSSYICLADAIWDKHFSHRSIALNFHRLVEKEDYLVGERRAILHYLDYLTNEPRKVKKWHF